MTNIRARCGVASGLLLLSGTCAAAALVAACTGEVGSGGKKGTDEEGASQVPTETLKCTTPEQSFEQELYIPVFSRCVGCHNELGLAPSEGAGLTLRMPGDQGFVAENTAALTKLAKETVDVDGTSVSVLLAKPTGQMPHGGGEVLAQDGNQALLLASFVEKLNNPPTCEAPENDARSLLASLPNRSPRETYARAALLLTGAPAEPEDVWAMEDTEAALSVKLDGLLERPGYFERLGLFYADWFLTEGMSTINANGDIMFQSGWKGFRYWMKVCEPDASNMRVCCLPSREACCTEELPADQCDPDVHARQAQDSVANEPIAFLQWIARQGLPITETVTADYTVLNPYTAAVFGLSLEDREALFDGNQDNNRDEWVKARIPATERNELPTMPNVGDQYPHVGMLASTAMLGRYYTTRANLNRTRSVSVVLERLLALPIRSFADFSTAVLPQDADLETATSEHPACLACHTAIDPIAAHFRQHFYYGFPKPEKYWLPDSFPEASFYGEKPASNENPVAWLGQRIAERERFRLAMASALIEGVTGTQMLAPPRQLDDPGYAASALAFRLQQTALAELLSGLPEDNTQITFQALTKAVVMSPFFRAGIPEGASQLQMTALAESGLGGGVMATPELLDVKFGPQLGIPRVEIGPSSILGRWNTYRYVLGGTNWFSIPERYREPNPVSLRALERFANEAACQAVVQNLAKPAAERTLFKSVEVGMLPEGSDRATFEQELRWLHLYLLGEVLPPDHAELAKSLEIWNSVRASTDEEKLNCTTDALAEDPTYTVQAWTGLLSYLITDPRYILE